MPLNPHFLLAARHGMLDQLNTYVSASGILNIYAGVQPADVSSAVTAANVILATPAMAATAFAAATASAIAANAIVSDASAAGSTTASAAWFSICKSTGLRVIDGSVGTATSDLILNSVMISTGATVAITAFTVTSAA
jgi:hypothetical protein